MEDKGYFLSKQHHLDRIFSHSHFSKMEAFINFGSQNELPKRQESKIE